MGPSGDELKVWLKEQANIARLYVHDFKNPVAALSANLSYLEAVVTDAGDDVREAIGDSLVALRSLTFMLDNYLHISRLEAKEPNAAHTVELMPFVREIVERCVDMIQQGDPRILLEGDPPPLVCTWPIVPVRMALENLIMAAAHNTPSGGTVYVSVSVESDRVHISTRDTGRPVGSDYLSRSFDRSFQSQAKGLSDARYGRAMAMYAIQLGAKHSGGAVRIETDDQGQRFILTLPI